MLTPLDPPHDGESGFFVPYPTDKEASITAPIARVFSISRRVAAADRLSELNGDPYYAVRMHLERNPALVKLRSQLVGRSLSRFGSSDPSQLVDWFVHGVPVGEKA